MGLPAHKFRGHDYMPIKLKALLVARGITQPTLADAVKQTNGQPLSRSTLSLLINWGYWPKSTSAESIKQQVEAWLRDKKVPEVDIATCWDSEEGDDKHRHGHPLGVHDGQAAPKPAGFGKPKPDFDPMEVEMLSPAAKRHFKLFRDPFQDEVNGPDDVFLSEDQRYISEAMFQTAKNGGFLAVSGESGSGKSTLRKMLIERIRELPIRLIFPQTLDKSKLSTGNICQAIINDLAPGATVRSSLEAQARQVRDVLLASAQSDFNHVLLIEEAHDISIATLKYLKRFYEIEDGFRKLLSIILVGQPELRDKLDERRYPEAREVIRRIEVAELAPLGGNLESYLAHKLKRLNVDPASIFAPDAYDAIRGRWTKTRPGSRDVLSQLYPLIVNNTVTKAMNRAAEDGLPLITGDLIREV